MVEKSDTYEPGVLSATSPRRHRRPKPDICTTDRAFPGLANEKVVGRQQQVFEENQKDGSYPSPRAL